MTAFIKTPPTRVIDPVCGMTIDTSEAAGTRDYQGTTFYFCSKDCLQTFDADPRQFAGKAADRQPEGIITQNPSGVAKPEENAHRVLDARFPVANQVDPQPVRSVASARADLPLLGMHCPAKKCRSMAKWWTVRLRSTKAC